MDSWLYTQWKNGQDDTIVVDAKRILQCLHVLKSHKKSMPMYPWVAPTWWRWLPRYWRERLTMLAQDRRHYLPYESRLEQDTLLIVESLEALLLLQTSSPSVLNIPSRVWLYIEWRTASINRQ